MALPAKLIADYRAAHYAVFVEPELVIHIGEPNARLDALLESARSGAAAYLTAANPRGRRRNALWNRAALLRLEKLLGKRRHRHREGEGRDPQGRWSAEPSFLVIGIARTQAESLGRRFGQNAIVYIEKGRAPELVLLT